MCTPEIDLHQQLGDSPPTQRKQPDLHQERSTRRHHIAQNVYGNTRKKLVLGKGREVVLGHRQLKTVDSLK